MVSDIDDSRPAPSRLGKILGLIALVAVVAVGAFFLGWSMRSNRVSATALFEVSRNVPSVLSGVGHGVFNEREFEILRKTQLALLKSNFVLTAAIRNPKVGGLSLLGEHEDPVAWLQERLEVSYPNDGEILSISLPGTEDQSDELVSIVDAIANAYKDEVVNVRSQRRLTTRDLLARSLENLNSEIKHKMEDYLDIAEESGRAVGSGQILQELSAKRIERVDDEIVRLESDLAINSNGDASKRKAIEQRIRQLRDQLSALSSEVKTRAERSADLELRERDLQQLQSIAGDMSVKLEQLDIDASSPDQIMQVQQAVIARN